MRHFSFGKGACLVEKSGGGSASLTNHELAKNGCCGSRRKLVKKKR
jgi:hypothetical protein